MHIANINTLARFLSNTTSANFSDANLLMLVNKYYEEVTGRILAETSIDWPYGDFNYTAFPTFTITMTAGTQSYDLRDWGTTDETAPLVILGAEVLDDDGDWHVLKRISLLKDVHPTAQAEYAETDGLPYEYELRDNLIVLYPAPAAADVTVTNGLKLFFLRTADRYTSAEVTTGTKEPGFPSPWHDILSYGMAYDYAIANNLPNANFLRAEYDRRMNELLKFIAHRDKTVRPRITTKPINFR